jgi:interferon gamma-inducible protein 30
MFIKILALFALIAVSQAQRQLVKVYYESLCPDSQKFITEQLYPALTGPQSLAKYVDLKLIPYGKSTYRTQGDDVKFECHHGPNECFGNKVQSCALKMIQVNSFQREHTRESLILEYVNCLMQPSNNFADALYPGQKCANATKVEQWPQIDTCAKSIDGSKYLQANGMETETLNPKLTSVPTITFGHQFDADIQAGVLVNFRKQLCKALLPMVPTECHDSNNMSAGPVLPGFIMVAITFVLSRIF